MADSGYQIDAVERGDDAIDQLKFYEYDVAILDWRMPGAEGIDVVTWARRHDRPTALLMLTARDTPPDRVRGLDAGADDYLENRSTSASCSRGSARSSDAPGASTDRS